MHARPDTAPDHEHLGDRHWVFPISKAGSGARATYYPGMLSNRSLPLSLFLYNWNNNENYISQSGSKKSRR